MYTSRPPFFSPREMILVRHFEAAVFPLVIQLRRSLFADLSAFSSDALAALAAGGATADAGANQREAQVGEMYPLHDRFPLLVM